MLGLSYTTTTLVYRNQKALRLKVYAMAEQYHSKQVFAVPKLRVHSVFSYPANGSQVYIQETYIYTK